MVSIVLTTFIFLISSSQVISDDYLENVSVNTGETATLICDLPERYSNKRVSSHAIYHLLLFFSSPAINKHNKHDYVVFSLGKYP